MAKFTKIKYHTFVITKTIATYFVYYCGEEEKQREIQQTKQSFSLSDEYNTCDFQSDCE
jgi:hypothetical protein